MSTSNSKKSFFRKQFPPPHYLRMPSVGFDISNQSVRFIELIQKAGHTEVLRYGERKIPQGLIYSEDVSKNEALKGVLLALKKEEHITFMNVSLPEDKAYLFKITIPKIDEKEIRGAVELQIIGDLCRPV